MRERRRRCPFEFDEASWPSLLEEAARAITQALALEWAAPVLPPVSGAQVRARLDEPLPEEPTPAAAVLAAIPRVLFPVARRNGHPRFFGYIGSCADPVGVLADTVASALNQNVTAWRSAPGAAELERLVVRWLDAFVGFEGGGHGMLLGGGSAANLAALAMAVRAAELRTSGPRERMTVYLSREGHLSLVKAARVVGVPQAQIRRIGVDEERRLDVRGLAKALREDRAAGFVPACVAASAGTVTTGAVDPLVPIADLAREWGAWFHVDGAYGAPAAATRRYASMRQGFSRADSLTLDPHKWLFAPLDAGCLLYRNPEAARAAFREPSPYTAVEAKDPVESHAFFDEGPELSRRFRALKVWAILKARGRRMLAREIERQIELRERLEAKVKAAKELELVGSGLSICCFRYRPRAERDDQRLDALNRAILRELVRRGDVFLSPAELEGRAVLRVCIISFRTAEPDLDFLVEQVLEIGRTLARSNDPG